jgi:hypothetical protein
MPFDTQHIQQLTGTLVSAALVAFFMYRRFRRNFGKQLLRRGYMTFRLVLLALIGVFLLPGAAQSSELLLTTGAGLVVGIGLGIWAARHLRFENHDGKLYYIPHTYAGMIVTALFIGRILYRFIVVAPILKSSMQSNSYTPSNGDLNSLQAYTHNPVTRGIFFILISYYVLYYAYVLWESKHLKPGDFEDQSPSAPKA